MTDIKNVANTLAKMEFPFRSFFITPGCMMIFANSSTPRNAAPIPQTYFKNREYGASRLPSAASPSMTPAVGIGIFLNIIRPFLQRYFFCAISCILPHPSPVRKEISAGSGCCPGKTVSPLRPFHVKQRHPLSLSASHPFPRREKTEINETRRAACRKSMKNAFSEIGNP